MKIAQISVVVKWFWLVWQKKSYHHSLIPETQTLGEEFVTVWRLTLYSLCASTTTDMFRNGPHFHKSESFTIRIKSLKSPLVWPAIVTHFVEILFHETGLVPPHSQPFLPVWNGPNQFQQTWGGFMQWLIQKRPKASVHNNQDNILDKQVVFRFFLQNQQQSFSGYPTLLHIRLDVFCWYS